MAGASPDGLVGDEGLIECKCPNTATHIDTLLSQTVPNKYNTQMQFQMACTGRSWCDFVSFDNRLPEELQLFVKRVPRDDVFIKQTEDAIVKFLAELDEKIIKLMKVKNV
jgi:predicted phage-related endonuclease